MGSKVVDCVLNFLKRKGRKIRLAQYDDFTIERFFRAEGAKVGCNNRIEIRSLGTEPFLVEIGDHCTIAPGVQFLTHDGGTWLFTDEIPDLQRFGRICIKDNCFVGTNVVLLPGVCIGPNAIVGAGAVVSRDVPPDSVAVGNPAKVISSIAEYRMKVVRAWDAQKPPGYFGRGPTGPPLSPKDIADQKKQCWALLRKHLTDAPGEP